MKLLLVDCDSTLSALEGIDELARLRGPEVFRSVEEATTQAMDGSIAIGKIFGLRLELIKPTSADCAVIGQQYIDNAVPDVKEALDRAKAHGWTVIIVSGGFVQCIQPLAAWLDIERIEAVPLHFDENGEYAGFDENYPSTRNGGKVDIVESLRAEFKPSAIVMVGDGVSDLETKPAVDLFIGFGGVVARPKVQAEAEAFLFNWSNLDEFLKGF